MKKLLKEELYRIYELMKFESNIILEVKLPNWLTRITGQIVGLNFEAIQTAARKVIKKNISKFEELTEDELRSIFGDTINLSLSEQKALTPIKKIITDEIANLIGIKSVQDFTNKTASEINLMMASKGIDPYWAGKFKSWYNKLYLSVSSHKPNVISNSSSHVGTIGGNFIDLPSWVSKWVHPAGNHITYLASLFEKVAKYEKLPFDPKQIKLLNKIDYHSIEKGMEVQRGIIEIQLPPIKKNIPGEKIVVYSSTGLNTPELKQKGDWVVIPGFQQNPYNPKDIGRFVKTEESVRLTMGLNPYLTQLHDFLKRYGPSALGR